MSMELWAAHQVEGDRSWLLPSLPVTEWHFLAEGLACSVLAPASHYLNGLYYTD